MQYGEIYLNKLYHKNEIGFAIFWIVIYVTGATLTDWLSTLVGLNQIFTFIFLLTILIFIITWIKKNNLLHVYGLCSPQLPPKKMLYYIPLLILVSTNLWLGINLNVSIIDSIVSALTLLCVGFVEEIIFRGFLFKALEKDNVKTAIVISSVTFGLGHIINLFTSQGASILSNVCQIFYAVAVGFLFVVIFWKGKSLWPCILTHSLVNALSIFMNYNNLTAVMEIIISVIIIAVAIIYSLIILRVSKTTESTQQTI